MAAGLIMVNAASAGLQWGNYTRHLHYVLFQIRSAWKIVTGYNISHFTVVWSAQMGFILIVYWRMMVTDLVTVTWWHPQYMLIYSQSRLIYSVSQSMLIYTVCWLPRDSALSEWLWLVPAPPHNTAGVLTPGTGTEGRALSEETFMPITAPSSGEKTNQANFNKTLAPNEKWLWSIHFFFFVFQVLKYSIEHH